MDHVNILYMVRLRWRAELARRARIRKDAASYRRNLLACFDILASVARRGPASEDTKIPSIRDCEPVIDTHGGFFSCVAISASGERFFAKCVRTEDRESQFWRGWQRGQVRTEGKYYRIVPPIAMLHGGGVSILAFPELEFIARKRQRRRELYMQDLDRVVRAIADFNSDHIAPPEGLVPVSQACDGPPTPGASSLARLLGIEAERAQEVAATLGRIEMHWGEVRDRIYSVLHCLCHMDAGVGNVTVHEGKGYILDFGRAGTGPPGADLHKIFRSLAELRGGLNRGGALVTRYTSVFAEKGIDLDPKIARQALDAHFAARYRTVRERTSRNLLVFEEALRASLELISATGSTGPDTGEYRRPEDPRPRQ